MENKESLMLERAYMFLEEKKWVQANEYCDKILDENPYNYEAHLIKLLADCKVVNKEELVNSKISFESNINYRRVLQYGDSDLKKKLQKNLEDRETRLNEKRKEIKNNKIAMVSIIFNVCFYGIFMLIIFMIFLGMIQDIAPSYFARSTCLVLMTIVIGLIFPISYITEKGKSENKRKIRKLAIINMFASSIVFGLMLVIEFLYIENFTNEYYPLNSLFPIWMSVSIISMPFNYFIGNSILYKKQKGEK